jgi:tetratricopeptide (TPR) repeat protein
MPVVSSNRSVGLWLWFIFVCFCSQGPLASGRQNQVLDEKSEITQSALAPGVTAESFEELAQQASSAREQGKSGEAIQYYEAALKIRPDWPDGWWYLGSLYADVGHYVDAIAAFSKLVELRPDFGPGWASLGLCEFEGKNYDGSFIHLKRAQELGLVEVPAEEKATVYHLALLLNLRGEFEDAWELLASKFGKGILPKQAKIALALALLRVPLLPDQIDPSKDALLDAAGETAAFLIQSNFDQALQSFRQMLKDYPNTRFLHYAYASALMFRSQYGEAEVELRAETVVNPRSALPYMRLAVVALKTHRAAEALSHAKRAVELAPNSAMAHEILARSYTELGKEEEGATQVALAAKLKPEKAQVDFGLVHVYERSDAANIDPRRPEPWVELALSEFEHKDYRNSYIHLERGRELGYQGNAQQMTVAVTRLAELRNLNGDFFGASDLLIPEARRGRLTEEMKIVLGMSMLRIPLLPAQVDSSGKPLLHAAGETAALLYASRFDETFRAFEQMLKDYPGTPYLHYAYASALETLSRYEEAEAHLRKETKITPESPLSYMRLASIELKQHHPEQAIEYAHHAVQLDSQAAGGHELMGRALLDLGRVDEAVKELEVASKLAPYFPEVHFNLARAYTKAKMKIQADQERALFAQLNAAAEREKSAEAQPYGSPQAAREPPSELTKSAPETQRK